MGLISKVNVDGTTHSIASSAYGVCNTAAATAAKTVSMSSFNTPINGMTIHVYFTYSNTASSPTLNVNTTGAKPIYRYYNKTPGTTPANSWQAGELVSLTYNTTANASGCWVMNDWNNTSYGTMTQAQATAGTSTESMVITPKVLHDTIVEAMPAPLSSYHVTLGDGTETTFQVSHYLNTQFILVSAVVTDNGTTYIASNSSVSGSSRISYIVDITNDNSFTITFSNPPAANSIKLSVISAIAYSSASDQNLLKI